MDVNKDEMEQLLKSVEPFIKSIAHTFSGRGIEYEDLTQTGYEGALIAIQNYREDGTAAFQTYAYYWITKYIRRVIDNDGRLIDVPVWVHEDVITPIEQTAQRLREELNRPPTFEELLYEQQLRDEVRRRVALRRPGKIDVDAILKLGISWWQVADVVSTDTDNSEALFVVDPASVEDRVEENIRNDAMWHMVYAIVGDRQAEIIVRRFILDDTLTDVSDLMGISRERVRQLESEALDSLRKDTNFNYTFST